MPLPLTAERESVSGRVAGREGAADDVVLTCLPLLLAQASHDLNNHLATILGKSEIALLSDDPARWRRGLDETFEAGHQSRQIVADLQRLVAWQQSGTEGPVPLGDVLALVVRLAGRSLRRGGAHVVVDGGSAILVDRPASVAVLGWLLVREAADRAEPGAGRGWRLEGRRRPDGWSLEFHGDGNPFAAAERETLERSGADGVRADGALGPLDRTLRALGGRLEFDGSVTRFAFR
jgi:hypothetical protein